MDTWALIIMVVGGAAWFYTRSKSPTKTGAAWAALIFGFGLGLLSGAVWATMIIRDAFGGLGQ